MSTALSQSCISLGYRVHPMPQFPQLPIRHRRTAAAWGRQHWHGAEQRAPGWRVCAGAAGRDLQGIARSLLHLLLHSDRSLRATSSVSVRASAPFCPEILPLFADLLRSLCTHSSHFTRDTLTHCAQREGSASSALPRNLSIKPPSSRSPLGPSTCTS